MLDVLRRYWLAALFAIGFLIAITRFRNIVAISIDGQTVLILGIATILVAAASKVFFFSAANHGYPVRNVVAFDAVVFIVLGSAATVLACSQWHTAVLLAGSSLMIGGFIGLLFGYPQGVAQQAANQNANPTNPPANATAQAANGAAPPGQRTTPAPDAPARTHAQNLVAESAATLGKVITGFTLAKVQGIDDYFAKLTNQVGPALGASNATTAPVLAGVIIVYFLATGFLCGLFLPPYFMSDVL
jgi:hypothetical protein